MEPPPTPPPDSSPVIDRRDPLREAFPQWAKMLSLFVVAGLVILTALIKSCQGSPGAVKPYQPRNLAADPGAIEKKMEEDRLEWAKNHAAVPPIQNPYQGMQQPAARGQAPEKTPTELQAEQMAAQRMKRDYDSLFSSPIAIRSPKEATAIVEAKDSPAATPVRSHDSERVEDSTESPDGPSSPGAEHAKKQHEYDLNHAVGKMHRLTEGTFLPCILVNRLDGSFAGPVVVQLAQDVYSQNMQETLMPAGTRIIGEAKRVSDAGQTRLAVSFHRAIMPNGYSVDLDQFVGLSQRGETGLADKINHHYLQLYGTALALGAIGGLSQLGNYGGYGYDPGTALRNGISSRMGQESEQILDRGLNRLPTIVIRAGNRVEVFLSGDLMVPEYANHRMDADL